jgi:hypothetical protein
MRKANNVNEEEKMLEQPMHANIDNTEAVVRIMTEMLNENIRPNVTTLNALFSRASCPNI